MQTSDNAVFHICLVQAWVQKEEKFLLARRAVSELQAGGEWSIPGGKMEIIHGLQVLETHIKAEVSEEVGVGISEPRYLHSHAFTRKDGAHVIGITFYCMYASGEAKPLEETSEVRWLSVQEIEQLDLKPWLRESFNALKDFLKIK